LDARFVSAPEATWRILKFPLTDRSHSISRLAVHLPERQSVFFQPGNEEQAVINAATRNTTLTMYFKLNEQQEGARQYYYREIPHHYLFDKKLQKWNPRKKIAKIIGRLYKVSVKQVERYCLRILLINVKGATSFEHLRTVDDNVYPTFKAVAIAFNFASGRQSLEKDVGRRGHLPNACSVEAALCLHLSLLQPDQRSATL
jgi:hypothetical protein